MFIVVNNWEVDHGSHDTSTKYIPEVDGKNEQPYLSHDVGLTRLGLTTLLLLLQHELSVFGVLVQFVGIEGEQQEGEYLPGGEDRSKSNNTGWLSNPIEVVGNTTGSGEQEHHNGKENGVLGHVALDEVHLHHHVGDDNSGEDLKGDLDPHVDNHPPPEVGNSKVGAGLDTETKEQEEDHNATSVQKPCRNRPYILLGQPRGDSTVDNEDPQHKSNKEEALEEATEFQEFPPLRSEPIGDLTGDYALVGAPDSDHNTSSNDA
eukprot:325459_1